MKKERCYVYICQLFGQTTPSGTLLNTQHVCVLARWGLCGKTEYGHLWLLSK